jgi:hypothetical protein
MAGNSRECFAIGLARSGGRYNDSPGTGDDLLALRGMSDAYYLQLQQPAISNLRNLAAVQGG